MKLEELIPTLKEVRFPGGPTLKARADLLAPMIADALKRLFPAEADVHCGWQTETLGYNWSGKHEWWLLVGDDLVRIHAAAVENSQDRRTLSVRIFPLARAAPTISLSYRHQIDEGGEREIVAGMEVELLTEGEPFKGQAGRDDLEALTAFVGHLQAAIARARLARGR